MNETDNIHGGIGDVCPEFIRNACSALIDLT